MEVLTMKKTYTVVATKTGKEWKSFNDGMDMLDDNKTYRMEWKLEGLWNAIRGWWSIKRKRHGSMHRK